MAGNITVLVGGQYGSEGKGAIAAHFAKHFDVAVRVGSHNAGHTFYWNGEKHVQQCIPCAWTNPNCQIVIGRGAILPVDGLLDEIEHIEKYYPDFTKRLFIDEEAGVLEPKYTQAEGGKDGWFNSKIGSTGEGCGAARVARINRDPDHFLRWKDIISDPTYTYDSRMDKLAKCVVPDTPGLIYEAKLGGLNVMVEGTQGSDLSLLHSHWPYCTSIDTNAAGIIAECGISPLMVDDVLMVCRTYPIRVAGNSGPMKNEITWEELFGRMGKTFEPEKTTVTKKVRRIAEWDSEQFDRACKLNTPTRIAITFADYVDPEIAGMSGVKCLSDLPVNFLQWLRDRSSAWTDLEESIICVGTGPDTIIDIHHDGVIAV